MTGYLLESNYYRAFALTDYNLTGGFLATAVTFGVYSATAGASRTTQPAEISIYAYTGPIGSSTIDLSKLTKYGELMVQIMDTATPMMIEAPIDAELPAATPGLVIQLHLDDGHTAMHQLSIGTNQQGEQAPGYDLAPNCGVAAPATFPAVGLAGYALVLSVTGEG